MTKNQFLVSAAVAGILGAGALSSVPALAGAAKDMGHCVGANACKGKGGCAVEGGNSCKGQAEKGKGWVEMSHAKCDKMAKKNKAVHFEPKAAPAAEEKKS